MSNVYIVIGLDNTVYYSDGDSILSVHSTEEAALQARDKAQLEQPFDNGDSYTYYFVVRTRTSIDAEGVYVQAWKASLRRASGRKRSWLLWSLVSITSNTADGEVVSRTIMPCQPGERHWSEDILDAHQSTEWLAEEVIISPVATDTEVPIANRT